MEEKLWKFTDDQASFISSHACGIKALYFPLCNQSPAISCVSPDLHGDLKTGLRHYLLEPVSRLSLSNSKASRNFWVYINPKKIWSITGVSKSISDIEKYDTFVLEAGLLWHKITRENKKLGLKAKTTSFIPSSGEPIEIMFVEIENLSRKPVKFTPSAAIPVFGRSLENLQDHRHVTSLLQRIRKQRFGVVVKPTLSFDETGHKKNTTSYFVFGIDSKNNPPQYIYPTQEEFTGEGSDLEAPQAVFKDLRPKEDKNIQGKEAMAGLKFKPCTLKPKGSISYIITMGITKKALEIDAMRRKFDTKFKVTRALDETKENWRQESLKVRTETRDHDFDNWLKWVNIQPVLRKIFGCSFLPDFDYGKGGRGWRDLWQDCLSIILNNPKEAEALLINNFSGVRIDGSNATVIGQRPGEFIADRNNISRVWMDHGAWPLLTTELYIHQTGNIKILLEEAAYFKDYQLSRSRERDFKYSPQEGKELKTKDGQVYRGSILEHILVENLTQFFNVGAHNIIRLEGADWNDGLDMAQESGESVAFSCIYAQNLKTIAALVEKLGQEKITLFKELLLLLNSLTQKDPDYSDAKEKQRVLEHYFLKTKYALSGMKVTLSKEELIRDLAQKAEWLSNHIRSNEWLKNGFFNGYYNNDRQRVEGNKGGSIRMTLPGQVFPVMSGVASLEQTKTIWDNACKYLKDKQLGGFHLNTDFGQEQPNLGRAFSFIYGDKENGAIFNHMCAIWAYALYKRGFAKEGYETLRSIYNMSVNTPKSKIYPCLPEYFNAEGRGMYSYLTGSASWFILALLTQAFGIRGEYGDLLIEPKLVAKNFKYSPRISINSIFADRPVKFVFTNPGRKDFLGYSIRRVRFNAKIIAENIKQPRFFISRSYFLSLANNKSNIIEILLD